eukprot:TRINITY_DN4266_c0_g1_i3.p1 TRINITY_DN4266_c0_g1~~TRINITY_DN4266_c0_g1_i3.p1  ORF type:complete len:108 (-),score=2.53 TRINITY_DN4266_c0_g1_i3:47-370(-)
MVERSFFILALTSYDTFGSLLQCTVHAVCAGRRESGGGPSLGKGRHSLLNLGLAHHVCVGQGRARQAKLTTRGHTPGLAPVLCVDTCLLYTSPSPRDRTRSRMPSSA